MKLRILGIIFLNQTMNLYVILSSKGFYGKNYEIWARMVSTNCAAQISVFFFYTHFLEMLSSFNMKPCKLVSMCFRRQNYNGHRPLTMASTLPFSPGCGDDGKQMTAVISSDWRRQIPANLLATILLSTESATMAVFSGSIGSPTHFFFPFFVNPRPHTLSSLYSPKQTIGLLHLISFVLSAYQDKEDVTGTLLSHFRKG